MPSNAFGQLRGGVTLGAWGLDAFIDNLFGSHTVTNYQLNQHDAYTLPLPPPSSQQNQYTFRPRTFGITATLRL